MTAWLKPYPGYKNSGVPWVGNIPEQWEVRKLRNLLLENADRNRADLPLLSVVREKGVIVRNLDENEDNHNFIPDDLSNYKVVRKGQFAMNKMKAWQGSYGISSYDGIVSPAYFVFTLKEVASDFFHAAIRSNVYVQQFNRASEGVRIGQWDLSKARMREIHFCVPPASEQGNIARFLNNAHARVRVLIRSKQKLIELLEEEKQAIIHRAITRGLDPNVCLKSSGVPWLGEMPEHWGLIALKRVCNLLRDGTHLPPPRQESGVPLLSVRNIIRGRFVRRDDDSFISDSDYELLCRSFVPRENDVLLAIVGATLGKVAVVPIMEPFHIQRSLAIFRPIMDRLSSEFLAIYLGSPNFQRALWSTVAFSAQPGIYLNTLSNFPITLPPLDEQLQILGMLSQQTEHFDRAISSVENEIALLREFRTRLIADVVTGKLDVREAGAKLPRELAETGPLDEINDLTQDDVAADEFEAEAVEEI